MGGQTALNLAVDLADAGILEKYDVELIGAKLDAIKKAEDRLLFKDAMQKIGLDMPRSAWSTIFAMGSTLPRRSASRWSFVLRLRLAAPGAASPTTAKS